MASPLHHRCELVARLLVALQGQGGPAYASASATQVFALKSSLSQTSLSLEQTAQVAEELAKIPWQCNQHRDEVLAALTAGPAVVDVADTSARRKMQAYTAVVNCFTEKQSEFFSAVRCSRRSFRSCSGMSIAWACDVLRSSRSSD